MNKACTELCVGEASKTLEDPVSIRRSQKKCKQEKAYSQIWKLSKSCVRRPKNINISMLLLLSNTKIYSKFQILTFFVNFKLKLEIYIYSVEHVWQMTSSRVSSAFLVQPSLILLCLAIVLRVMMSSLSTRPSGRHISIRPYLLWSRVSLWQKAADTVRK